MKDLINFTDFEKMYEVLKKEYEGSLRSVKDTSNSYRRGIAVIFNNDITVSIIAGGTAYTTEEKPFEIALIKEGSYLTREILEQSDLFPYDLHGDVIGYLTGDSVKQVLDLVSKL